MSNRLLAAIATILLCAALADGSTPVAAAGSVPGPVGAEASSGRRQLWLIPSPVAGLLMRAYLFRPAGNGPFPLAVINHGSDEDFVRRAFMPMPSFDALTDWFLARGYAVLLPERPGNGKTGGPYIESQGGCASADYLKAGFATADSIAAAISFIGTQPFIKPRGIVVVGNSAGGWGALALAARNPAHVAAVVNFAGGRGGRESDQPGVNCAPDRLVATAGKFGASARIPTLWLYAANDSYFAPALASRMAEAFRAAGGKVEYDPLPAIKGDGHLLIQSAGAQTWEPYLAKFIAKYAR